jgi:hypothetical protein
MLTLCGTRFSAWPLRKTCSMPFRPSISRWLQHADALVLGAHLFAGDAEGLAHADDLVRGQRARAHAALVAAAVHLRLDAHARLAPHVQRADALGAVGLVRGQAHQVDRQRLQVDGDLAGGLRRVDVEDDAALAAHRADGRDVLDHADLVVDEHHRDQDGVGAHRALNLSRSSRPSSWTSR